LGLELKFRVSDLGFRVYGLGYLSGDDERGALQEVEGIADPGGREHLEPPVACYPHAHSRDLVLKLARPYLRCEHRFRVRVWGRG